MERAFLSDFEVLKGTADLLGRHLIEPGKVQEPLPPLPPPPAARRASRLPPASVVLWAVLGLLIFLSVRWIPRNPANLLLRRVEDQSLAADLFKAVSLNRARSISRAVRR